jgi:hypothetical protein
MYGGRYLQIFTATTLRFTTLDGEASNVNMGALLLLVLP